MSEYTLSDKKLPSSSELQVDGNILYKEKVLSEILEETEREPLSEEIEGEAARLWAGFLQSEEPYDEIADKEAALNMAKLRSVLQRKGFSDILFDFAVEEEEGNWNLFLLNEESILYLRDYLDQAIGARTEFRRVKSPYKHHIINTGGRGMSDKRRTNVEVAKDVLRMLGILQLETDGKIFRRGADLVKIRDDLFIERLKVSTLSLEIAKAGIKIEEKGKAMDKPPVDIVRAMIGLQDYPGFRELRTVVRHPIITPEGRVISGYGYDGLSKVFIADKSTYRTDKDPIEAARHIQEEILFSGDGKLLGWPFLTPADKANAFAFLITPFLRPLIPMVPMALLLRRSRAGTGTSLLCEVLLSVSQGEALSSWTWPDTEEALEKKIGSYAETGEEVLWFNNVRGSLESQVLEEFLTSEEKSKVAAYSGKKGKTKNVLSLCLSGEESEVKLRSDGGRRMYSIILNAKDEYPSLRQGFKHNPVPLTRADGSIEPANPIKSFALKHRKEFIEDILSMAAAWHREGSPILHRGPPLGSFEQWAIIIGSILAYAGVLGFLDNIDYSKSLDRESLLIAEFLRYWFKTSGDKPLVAVEVMELIEKTGGNLPLPARIAAAMSKKKPQTSLGMTLKTLAESDLSHEGLKLKSEVLKTGDRTRRNLAAFWVVKG